MGTLWSIGPSYWWHLPWTVMSSVGVLDQPGYWPPEYVAASRAILVLLTAYLGFKALFLPFSFPGEEE